MGKAMHPSMEVLSPAADTSLSDSGIVFASVNNFVQYFFNEWDERSQV